MFDFRCWRFCSHAVFVNSAFISTQSIIFLITFSILQDLLENEDVKLDDMLKFSLINDLAKVILRQQRLIKPFSPLTVIILYLKTVVNQHYKILNVHFIFSYITTCKFMPRILYRSTLELIMQFTMYSCIVHDD